MVPFEADSVLARISAWFPVRHLTLATFAPYDPRRGADAFAGHDLAILAVWVVVGVVIAVRRFRWEPRRACVARAAARVTAA